MARLKALMAATLARGATEPAGYAIYPAELPVAHKARRAAVGEAMYGHLGIPRDDKAGRLAIMAVARSVIASRLKAGITTEQP